MDAAKQDHLISVNNNSTFDPSHHQTCNLTQLPDLTSPSNNPVSPPVFPSQPTPTATPDPALESTEPLPSFQYPSLTAHGEVFMAMLKDGSSVSINQEVSENGDEDEGKDFRGYIGIEYYGCTVSIKILPVGVHLRQLQSVLDLPETEAKVAELLN
ncbi:hypothetical protein IEQ34_006838 [Dendrobium chrysotoxum]|uniref:Uncharacterized protein n=1 Tax=Dendrobium chrysotoxum TaxID=161865 RepID=A0AAV7H567_DENCH|nr:hypothetical protein IEQ34_006838 [Dendrobium chrysotoxum]